MFVSNFIFTHLCTSNNTRYLTDQAELIFMLFVSMVLETKHNFEKENLISIFNMIIFLGFHSEIQRDKIH